MVRINLTIAPLPAQERGASGGAAAHAAASRRNAQRAARGASAAPIGASTAVAPKGDAPAPGGKVTFEEHQQPRPHTAAHANSSGTPKSADAAGERTLKRAGSTLSASVLMAASQLTQPPETSHGVEVHGAAVVDASSTGDALTDVERFGLLAVYYSRRLPGSEGDGDGETDDATPVAKQHHAHSAGISQRVSAPAGSYLLATVTTSAGVAPPVNAGGTPITTTAMLQEVLQICGLPCPDDAVRAHAPFLLTAESGCHGRVLSAAEFLAVASDVKRDMQSVAAHRDLTLQQRPSRRGRGRSTGGVALSGVAAMFMSGIAADDDGHLSDSSESSDSPGNSPARRATSPALTKSSLARLLRNSGGGGEAGGLMGTGPAARARLALIAERLRPACDLVNAAFHALQTLPAACGGPDPDAAPILLHLGDPAASATPSPASNKARANAAPLGAEATATASPMSDATVLHSPDAQQQLVHAVQEASGDLATVLAASWGVLEASQVNAVRDAVDGLDDIRIPVPLITDACRRFAAAAAVNDVVDGGGVGGGGPGVTPRANRSIRSNRSPSTTPQRRQSHMRRPSAAFGRSIVGLLGGGTGVALVGASASVAGVDIDELLAGVTVTPLAVGPVLDELEQAGFGFDRGSIEHVLVTDHGSRLEEQLSGAGLSANLSRSSFGGALTAASSFRLRSSSSNPATPGGGLIALEPQHAPVDAEPLTAATAFVPCVLLTELAMALADDDDEAGAHQEDAEAHNAALDGALEMAIRAVPQGSQYQLATHPLADGGGGDSRIGPRPGDPGSPGELHTAHTMPPQPWSFASPPAAPAAARTSNPSTTEASPAAASISGPASTKVAGAGQGSASNHSLAGTTATGASHARRGSTTILHDDPPGASDTPLGHSGAQRRRSFVDGAASEGERSRRGSDAASLTNVDARTLGGASSGLGGGSQPKVGGTGAPSLMRTASMVSSATRSRRGNMKSTLLAHKVAAVSVLAHRPKKIANAGVGGPGGRRGSVAQAATDYLPPCDVCEMNYRDFRVTPKLRSRPDDTPQFVRCPSAGSRFLESFERNYRRPDHEVADNSPTRASRLRETCGRFRAGALRDRDATVSAEVGSIPRRAATPGPTPDVPGLTDADPLSVMSSTFPQQQQQSLTHHNSSIYRQRSPVSPLSRNGDSSTMTEAAKARRSSPDGSVRQLSRRQSASLTRPGSAAATRRDSSRAGNVALAPREKSRPYSYTPYFGQSLMPQVPTQGGKGVWAPRMDKGDFAAVLRKEIAVLKADWARRT